MAETSNIGKIAEFVSKDIFDVFGWRQNRIVNSNWDCVHPDEHHCKTHPSDVVWYYEEPYVHKRTYIQTDLKSYGKNAIKPAAIANAIVNLAKAVECSEKSESWKHKYLIEGDKPFSVVGLLFIYNHDGDFDKSFEGLLTDTCFGNTLSLPPRGQVFVMGPKMIWELYSIAEDLKKLRYELDSMVCHAPFYPECRRNQFRLQDFASENAATIDYLFSNVLAFKAKSMGQQCGYQQLHIYYRGAGKTTDEFLHLIDYCFRYQQIDTAEKIVIHFVGTNDTPIAEIHENFERARQEYCVASNLSSNKLDPLEPETLTIARPRFCPEEIGMRG